MEISDVIALVCAMVVCTWTIVRKMNTFVTHDDCRRRRREYRGRPMSGEFRD